MAEHKKIKVKTTNRFSKLQLSIFTLLFAGIGGYFIVSSFAATGSCDLNVNTSNFSSQVNAAQPGQTICLATGSYGTYLGADKASPGVTITPQVGASVTISIDFRAPSGKTIDWLIFDGIQNIKGGEIAGNVRDITVKNSTFTQEFNFWQASGVQNNACSNCQALTNTNILFDNNVFNESSTPLGPPTYEGRISFIEGSNQPAGVIIKNSIFENNCSDGVQFSGGGNGVTIGPGNEFRNLKQASCSPHVDPIQFVGSDNPGPIITGNYFHDNSTGIIGYDGATEATITNNVVTRTTQHHILVGGLANTSKIENNTVIGGSITCASTHQNNACFASIKNNVISGGGVVLEGSSAPVVNDYNLCSSACLGSHSITGSPTFFGGANSTTYAGFALASGSLGKNAGSDGKDMGIISSGISAPKPGDTNGDNVVNVIDLSTLLSKWNTNFPSADFNKDNIVNVIDLSTLLSNYGK